MGGSGRRGGDEPPRFRVRPGELGDDRVRLADDESRHVRVMRLRSGDRVRLFDGAGAEALAELHDVGETVVARVLEALEPVAESPCRCVLVQAVPVKVARFDDVVRLVTELGVAEAVPVRSGRGELPGGGVEVLVRRAERWRRIAAAAAKQCGRSVVPDVRDPVAYADLDWQRLPEPRLLLDTGEAARPLGEVLAARSPTAATLLVGPEGGWTADEVADAREHGAVAVRLGPRVLRADSAGAAALAIVQHAWGDL